MNLHFLNPRKQIFLLLISALVILPYSSTFGQQSYYDVTASNGNGIRFWSSNNYKIHMGNSSEYKYGPVTDYSIKFNMSNTTSRGWTWGVIGYTPVAALNTQGHFQIKGNMYMPSGNLGVGTSSPSYRLHVAGDIYAASGWIRSTGDYGLYNNSDGTYFFSDSGDYWRMRSGKGLIMANSSNSIKGYIYHNSNNDFGFLDGDGNWSVKIAKDNHTAFLINNSEKMRILSSGNVGIGTTNPSYKLHVNGTINATSILVNGAAINTPSAVLATTGGYLDDDGTAGGNNDDWIRFNGYVDVKSNTDNYGIVLRDKDNNEYLGLTQKNGASYLADSQGSGGYFLSGNGRHTYLGDNLYGKSVNGAHSKLYRFGGLFLTWDSDSYGTNDHHSIRSTYGDTYGDEITINSYNHLRINLDANSNDSNSYFEVGQHTTGTSNILMRLVSPTGNLGVGTTSPSYKIHAAGDVYADGGWLRVSGDQGMYFESYGGGFHMTDNTWIRTYNNKSFYHNSGTMRTDGTFQVGSSGSRFVVNTSGNVGIGQTSPGYRLDVNGTINATDILINGQAINAGSAMWTATGSDASFNSGNVGIGTTSPLYKVTINTSNENHFKLENNSENAFIRLIDNGDLDIWAHGDDPILFRRGTGSGTESMRINSSGNVGIGTSSPDELLTVAGKIKSEEVIVEVSNPPDYVFSKEYNLKPLQDIEKFIQENSHLPEVPSAKEMEANGVEVGEMNMLLLKKIEELTLYVIDLKKENKIQNEQIVSLLSKTQK